MFKKPIVWIALVALAAVFTAGGIYLFPLSFPLLSVDLKMDRAAALRRARELAVQFKVEPVVSKEAASFSLDDAVQNYVELEAGGVKAFRAMVAGNLYSPFIWQVRHFVPSQKTEATFFFKPNGESYGFEQTLPESQPGASLSPDAALEIARTVAQRDGHIDLTPYVLATKTHTVQPGGRVDHTFLFERPQPLVGTGHYRLKLVVSGDRVSAIEHEVEVPEAFKRRYEQMRSTNEIISYAADGCILVLYLIGGGIGMFYLLRHRWLVWSPAVWAGTLIALGLVLGQVNQFPLQWMGYKTADSKGLFLLTTWETFLAEFLGAAAFFSLVIMLAESLTRRAFPRQVRFWSIWKLPVAASPEMLGKTIGGYLMVSFDLLYVTTFYIAMSHWLGWWSPSEMLMDPDLPASYFPWFTPVATALQAGFTEECLFRAVPLAGAALIGDRLGKRKLCIGIALIVQALIFGAAHANYPAEPAYARLVELIVPSLIFAALYLRFGLLTGIIAHFTYDAVLMSSPLFTASTPGIWLDRSMVILFVLTPVWVLLFRRIRHKAWASVGPADLNQSWTPAAELKIEEAPEPPNAPTSIPGPILAGVVVAGLLALVALVFVSPLSRHFDHISIGRSRAEAAAREEIARRNIHLDADWKTLSEVKEALDDRHRFAWQNSAHDAFYRLFQRYLRPAIWEVRFAKWTGDVADRAEEYDVYVDGRGQIVRFIHEIPAERPMPTLNEAEAHRKASELLANQFHLTAAQVREVEADPDKKPARTDWTLIYSVPDENPMKAGETRLRTELSGNEITDSIGFIFVPDDWERNDEARQKLIDASAGKAGLIAVVGLFAACLVAVVAWSRHQFNTRAFLIAGTFFFLLKIVIAANDWPRDAIKFMTDVPWGTQVLQTLGLNLLGALCLALRTGLIVGLIHARKRVLTPFSTGTLLLLGIGLGLLFAVARSVLFIGADAQSPPWPDYQFASAWLPSLAIVLGKIADWIGTTLFFFVLYLFANWMSAQGRRKTLAVAVFILGGIAMLAGKNVPSLSAWLLAGTLVGLCFAASYFAVLRWNPAPIPLICAVIKGAPCLREALFHATPAWWAWIAAAIILLILGLAWGRALDRTRTPP